LVAALLRVARVAAGPAESSGSLPPGLQLPSQPLRGLLPISLLGEQRHDGCEQFAYDRYPTASRLRFESAGPSAPDSSTLTTRLPSHPEPSLKLNLNRGMHGEGRCPDCGQMMACHQFTCPGEELIGCSHAPAWALPICRSFPELSVRRSLSLRVRILRACQRPSPLHRCKKTFK